MWQLDSTHKLIKCKFVASGMVDGHIRMILWLQESDDNRAQTTGDMFREVTEHNVKPLQVRGDCST